VRASVGYLSTDADVDTLIEFIRNEYVIKGFKDAKLAQRCLLDSSHSFDIERVLPEPSTSETLGSEDYTLNRIYIYPIKSCAGIRVAQWPLSDNGLFLDREWAVVDALSRRVLTQKSHPRMALIETRLDLDSGELVVSTPSKSSELRLAISSHGCSIGTRNINSSNIGPDPSNEVVMVCQQPRMVGQDAGGGAREAYEEADEWLSSFLGTRCRLQRRAAPRQRSGEEGGDFAIDSAAVEDTVNNFVNEAQFLMITQASLGLISKVLY
jgi:hypothetical protein